MIKLKIVIGAQISIHHCNMDVKKKVIRDLTIKNPEYTKRRSMGLPIWGIQENIITYELDKENDIITVPRGYLMQLWKYWPDRSCYDWRMREVDPVEFTSGIQLRDYQEPAIGAVLKHKQGVVNMPCGSGKSETGLGALAAIGQPALWITHTKDLLQQSLDRAKLRLGLKPGQYGILNADEWTVGSHITFGMVQSMAGRDLSGIVDKFGAIVIDECFPAGTIVDDMPIEQLKEGDYIRSYNHSSDTVEFMQINHIFKSKPKSLVTVNFGDGSKITCTGNHPIYIENLGYIPAQELKGDMYARKLKLQHMWEYSTESGISSTAVLSQNRSDILLKEMQRGVQEDNIINNYGRNQQKICISKDEGTQSNVESRNTEKAKSDITCNGTQTTCEMGKWNGAYGTSTNHDGSISQRKSSCGISNSNTYEGERISQLLQSRYCNSKCADCYRIGREQSLCNCQAGRRSQEGCSFNLVRVDHVEVQEQTSDGTFGGLCPDGYVYNIEVKQNSNYFVNGILVHNCHHVFKNANSIAQFYKVISQFPAKYRIGLTATAHRSDGLIDTMFHTIGPIIYQVPQDQLPQQNIVTPSVEFVHSEFNFESYEENPNKRFRLMINEMIEDEYRNRLICSKLLENKGNYCLVLGESLKHLETIKDMCFRKSDPTIAFVHGKTKKDIRENIMQATRNGKINFLFATYSLVKEGLDIPRLNRMFLITPKKDRTIIQQSVGRVMRAFEGKTEAKVYDFLDLNIGTCINQGRERKGVYSDLGCEITGWPVRQKNKKGERLI